MPAITGWAIRGSSAKGRGDQTLQSTAGNKQKQQNSPMTVVQGHVEGQLIQIADWNWMSHGTRDESVFDLNFGIALSYVLLKHYWFSFLPKMIYDEASHICQIIFIPKPKLHLTMNEQKDVSENVVYHHMAMLIPRKSMISHDKPLL